MRESTRCVGEPRGGGIDSFSALIGGKRHHCKIEMHKDAKRVYFDTVSFRETGKALENAALPNDLRENLLVSPLSAFEVLSQLSIAKADEVLHQIQAIHNWINPERAALLPWPADVLANVGFGKPMKDNDFAQRMEKAFNVCLSATSAELLQEEAGKLKDVMDAMRLKTTQDFGRLLDGARKESPKGDWFSEAWFQGIAKRAEADPKSKSVSDLTTTFSAYHEFERVKLEAALRYKDYNVKKHQNDLLDAEQLIYLGSPELCFLTCDKGFARVNKSAQSARIIIVSPQDISDLGKIEALLRRITGPTTNAATVQSAV